MVPPTMSLHADRRSKAPPDAKAARRHTYAWYTYAFAAEVFAACAMAIFLPITLEQMAREIGFVAPDLVVPCTQVDGPGVQVGDGVGVVCKAKILGAWVDTASFSMYVKSIAVGVQAVAIISLGPLADSPFWRKKLLVMFAYMGSVSGIAFLLFPSAPAHWMPVVAALLTVLGNMGYATSIVCANAFLPGLARRDPDVVKAQPHSNPLSLSGGGGGMVDSREGDDEQEALLPTLLPVLAAASTSDLVHPPTADLVSPSFRTGLDEAEGHASRHAALVSLATSRISALGTGIGCASGVAVLALLTVPVTLGAGSTTSLCLAIGLSGLWWAVFTIPVWLGLPSEEGGLAGGKDNTTRLDSPHSVFVGWKRVGRMITPKQIQRLPNLYMLLFAWVFLSDGFHTTTYTAILYASVSLRMSPSKIIIIGILVQLAAVVSTVFAPRWQKRHKSTNLWILLRIVTLALILPLYACLGLVLPFGGLRTEAEMYVAATWFGLLYGPFNSYSRAVYAELVPPGQESSFFSLFALTDKSASFFGPFVVGLISDHTGNIRLGFLFLLALLLPPVAILLRVDIDKGKREAREWAVHQG